MSIYNVALREILKDSDEYELLMRAIRPPQIEKQPCRGFSIREPAPY
jgi:hypothetical protein